MNMPLIILALGLYLVFAEWRNWALHNKLRVADKNLSKIRKDKSLWYSGVLPDASKVCLIQEKSGEYIVSKLSDKYWLDKDGAIDFSKIKRWIYMEDLSEL